jgi:hypothetical protein
MEETAWFVLSISNLGELQMTEMLHLALANSGTQKTAIKRVLATGRVLGGGL